MPGGAADEALPRFPVNGHGSLIAHVPGADGALWVTGSTFERGKPRADVLPADHQHNLQRLTELLPRAANALAPQWVDGRAGRPGPACAPPCPTGCRPSAHGRFMNKIRRQRLMDKRQQLSIQTVSTPPLPVHLLTGLGARGLTLALLCADVLTAGLHGEPLPVERSLARRLRAGRWSDATTWQLTQEKGHLAGGLLTFRRSTPHQFSGVFLPST